MAAIRAHIQAAGLEVAITGVPEIDKMLDALVNEGGLRDIVVPPTRKALGVLLKKMRPAHNRRHPRSLGRYGFAGIEGPSHQFLEIKTSSPPHMGSRIQFKNDGPHAFHGVAKSTGKRYFYPASQEFGAPGARPPVAPKQPMKKTADANGPAVVALATTEMAKRIEKRAMEKGNGPR